jgi:hypothetical protein
VSDFAAQIERLKQETEAMTELVEAIGEYARVATENAVEVHRILMEKIRAASPPSDTETKA